MAGDGGVGGDAKAEVKAKQLEEDLDGPKQECHKPEHFYFQYKQEMQSVCWSA